MTEIYTGDIGVEFRLNCGINLSSATLMQIKVKKPSGALVTWSAYQYGTTQSIAYMTVEGDLDLPGDYILQGYVEVADETKLLGDSVTVSVLNAFTPNEVDDVQSLFGVLYRFLTVQTYDQATANPPTNTTTKISYDGFGMYLELAQDELIELLQSRLIPTERLTIAQSNSILCHLIADYFEMGNPDWSYKSQSVGPGVSFSRGEDTSARLAVNKLLGQIELAVKKTRIPAGYIDERNLQKIRDSENYPRRFKKTSIPVADFTYDGYDANRTLDIGDTTGADPWN